MSLSSFLTQDPMTYTPSTGQTSTSLPQWYNDYTQGVLQNASQWANQGYQAYPGPKVAPLSPDQQTSYGTVAGTKGLGSGIAEQGVQQLQNTLSTPLSSQMGQFMNPYMNQVVNTGNTLTNRAFNEQVMPGLQDQFTRAGQVYGASNQGVLGERMARDLNLNEQMASGNLLAGGFNTALGGAEQQANIGIQGAGMYGGLGTTAQQNALAQAQAQNTMGQQQQAQTQQNYNTGYQDFLNQVNYPLLASQGMQGALAGIQVPQGGTNYQYQPYGYGMSPLAQGVSTYGGLNSMFGPGGSQTAQTQPMAQPQPAAYQPPASTMAAGPAGRVVQQGAMSSQQLPFRSSGLMAGAQGGLVRFARGGSVAGTLHLPRRALPSAYQQWKTEGRFA